jgi:cell wall-associated NlpC family hydrolase
MDTRSAPQIAFAALATPLIGIAALLVVLGGAGASAGASGTVCGGAGTGQTIRGVTLDPEQIGNARTIVSVVAGRHLPAFAAEVAVTAAYTESTLHNSTTHTDHDSEGLFQQRISIYGKQVADNPVSASNAFLDRLIRVPGWQADPVGVDAQSVQHSAYPERYQPNAALGAQVVGHLWPIAAQSVAPIAADLAPPAVCPGAGGERRPGNTGGPTGSNVAGTTAIPAGFVISGSPKGRIAVRYALNQLGKPYVFGAAGPSSFDCSGLTMAAWSAAGIALPHLAAAQASAGIPEPTDLSRAVSGDLVMIPGSDGTAANPGHVGMIAGYVDRSDGRHLLLVQAAEVGVPIELSDSRQWSGQVVDVRHIA